MMEVKIGQELIAKEDYVIDGILGDESIKVTKGSKSIVNANGYIEHITGNARGKIQMLSEDGFKIKGYDVENIAKMILDRLKYSCDFGNTMEDYDLEESYVIDQIITELDIVLG